MSSMPQQPAQPPTAPAPAQGLPTEGLPPAPMSARSPGGPSVTDAMNIEGAQDTRPETQTVGPPTVGGLNPMFADRFSRLQDAVKQHGGTLYIFSGARDVQQQAQLFQDAASKFGSAAEAKKRVAPPGTSHHDPHAGLQYGIGDGAVGADLRGDLAIAHRLAPHFGLEFDKKTPWHVSIAGLKGAK